MAKSAVVDTIERFVRLGGAAGIRFHVVITGTGSRKVMPVIGLERDRYPEMQNQ